MADNSSGRLRGGDFTYASSKPGRSRRHAHGFTLIELLVVIGITAVLLAILLPALNKARIATKDTLCANNLRQLAMATIMYRDDVGKGKWPGCSFQPPPPAHTTTELVWPHNLSIVDINALCPFICVASTRHIPTAA